MVYPPIGKSKLSVARSAAQPYSLDEVHPAMFRRSTTEATNPRRQASISDDPPAGLQDVQVGAGAHAHGASGPPSRSFPRIYAAPSCRPSCPSDSVMPALCTVACALRPRNERVAGLTLPRPERLPRSSNPHSLRAHSQHSCAGLRAHPHRHSRPVAHPPAALEARATPDACWLPR